jgi:hypothetical protein
VRSLLHVISNTACGLPSGILYFVRTNVRGLARKDGEALPCVKEELYGWIVLLTAVKE